MGFYSVRAERLAVGAVVLAALLTACAKGAVRPTPRGKPEALDYVFTLDEQLTAMQARACFRGGAPADFMSGVPGGAQYLTAIWLETGAGRKPLALDDGRVRLSGAPREGCIGYTIDLTAASEPGSFHAQRRGCLLYTSPSPRDS